MDIPKMLTELRSEKQAVEEAILVLERLGARSPKRRGRPPKWIAILKTGVHTKAKKDN